MDDEVINTTVRVRKDLYELYKKVARSGSMSYSAFANQAMATRAKNWVDPLTGENIAERYRRSAKDRKYDGWLCTHKSHEAIPAAQCKHRHKQTHQETFFHPETDNMLWVDPEADNG